MGDIQTRPFSKNYSGLINQSVIALGITVVCVTSQELMRRRRRGNKIVKGLGSRESWEFGYLFQGRSWAKTPSPPIPPGPPLSWLPQVIKFSEHDLNMLRGVDAALYIRFLRGCLYFTVLHTLTTFPILFPIHVKFSDDAVSSKSMTRASISSLVLTPHGKSLLWIHICLLFWVTLSWICTLFWICHGAFVLRGEQLVATAKRLAARNPDEPQEYHPHPHPQYTFAEILPTDTSHCVEGIRLRTVMVSNLLPQLRDEKELKEYFEYYMSKNIDRPVLGVTPTTQPGFINRSLAFLFNRAKRLPAHIPALTDDTKSSANGAGRNMDDVPRIERVMVARKMTELASLLERREEILRLLETAHIKLANNVLLAVQRAIELRDANKPFARTKGRANLVAKQRKLQDPDVENSPEDSLSEEARMKQLIEVIGPFVEEFEMRPSSFRARKRSSVASSKHAFRQLRADGSQSSDDGHYDKSPVYPPTSPGGPPTPQFKKTIWDALLSLPRSSLDAYQPLINLSHLFRGKTVPSIDYYTAKLNLVTSWITEARSKPANRYEPVSTAFVTFADPDDARKACRYLTVHPNNPLTCAVTMAPPYQDLDWIRIMKSSFNGEFLKDWVVSLGVWAFTIFWLFPVSFLVTLVSIQNISAFWPTLRAYLDQHPFEEEVIQSFLPTLLVALLAILIPLILLLIGKKAHTITTLSALHDRIMSRYYKFLIVNVLVFFCVGTAALQSVLAGFKSTTTPDVLKLVADSFPTAGPFYVGWLIFTVAMHGGFEIALFGLPLLVYPATRGQVTPRKRAIGVRPRTLNYYYWLPTHMLVVHVLLLFSILNPVVLPFAAFYYFIETGIIKNQLIHVYAKHYEGNGKLILIRVVRYSLDGLILSQAVFLAYMVVLKKPVNVGLAAFLIAFTAVMKLFMTRMCRAQFDHDDIAEARIVCGSERAVENDEPEEEPEVSALIESADIPETRPTWRLPAWVTFTWTSVQHRPRPLQRRPNPFRHPRSSSLGAQISPVLESGPTSDTVKAEYHPSEINYRWPGSQAQSSERPRRHTSAESTVEHTGPVVPHSPPVTWDDQTTPDLPYDNPFYTRAISNVLWIPRNPAGKLNLDDTVDLKISLTVEVSASPLGTWSGEIENTHVPSTTSITRTSISQSPEAPTIELTTSPDEIDDVDGTEDIDLPEAIARRIGEESIDTVPTRRPSVIRHRVSSGKSIGGSLASRRKPSTGRPPAVSFRSFSEGSRPPSARNRSSSFLSAFEPQGIRRTQTTDQELGVRQDSQSSTSGVSGSLDRPRLQRAQNISAHHAIVHEVMAEEEGAAADRMEEEEAEEAKQATVTKSWLTSWMFKKAGDTIKPEPPPST